MSIIKSGDVAHIRIQVPDLEVSEQFLIDFGVTAAEREENIHYYRTSDEAPYCLVVSQGERKFLGAAFYAKSQQDLETLSRETGFPIEPIDGPCGGSRVRLHEPNGYAIDVVYGMTAYEPIVVKRQPVNSGDEPLKRAGEVYRLQTDKPTPCKRLAHFVIATPRVSETAKWFKDTLGAISSDDIVVGPDKDLMASFMRIDDGDGYVDHHTLFVVEFHSAGLQHISFEVPDFDAVLADHHYLTKLGRYEHVWGIGRHLLGSQVFDYWRDPNGIHFEHWADSDRLNASTPTNILEPRDAMVSQWGEEPPERFMKVFS